MLKILMAMSAAFGLSFGYLLVGEIPMVLGSVLIGMLTGYVMAWLYGNNGDEMVLGCVLSDDHVEETRGYGFHRLGALLGGVFDRRARQRPIAVIIMDDGYVVSMPYVGLKLTPGQRVAFGNGVIVPVKEPEPQPEPEEQGW